MKAEQLQRNQRRDLGALRPQVGVLLLLWVPPVLAVSPKLIKLAQNQVGMPRASPRGGYFTMECWNPVSHRTESLRNGSGVPPGATSTALQGLPTGSGRLSGIPRSGWAPAGAAGGSLLHPGLTHSGSSASCPARDLPGPLLSRHFGEESGGLHAPQGPFYIARAEPAPRSHWLILPLKFKNQNLPPDSPALFHSLVLPPLLDLAR